MHVHICKALEGANCISVISKKVSSPPMKAAPVSVTAVLLRTSSCRFLSAVRAAMPTSVTFVLLRINRCRLWTQVHWL